MDILPSDARIRSGVSSNPIAPGTSTDRVDDLVLSFVSVPGLSEHHFLRLTQYSLMRALVQNASILGLDIFLLMDDDATSPWTLANPYPALAPHDLIPTSVQLCTPHHPYLDIIAPPAVRDKILLAYLGERIEDLLCYDMHFDSFTVWGSQPWNAMGS